MKPTFGTPGAEIHELTEQATYVARAIHTLEATREWRSGDSTDMAVLFVRDSHMELRRLLKWFYAQGVKPEQIDFAAFVFDD